MKKVQVRVVKLTPSMAREQVFEFVEDPTKHNLFKTEIEPYHTLAVDVGIDHPAENYICCEELGKALGDHNGLHSQTIGSIHSDKIDEIIMYKGGDYKIRNRIVVQYCPFCGKPRRRASEYKKENV